jgi:exopolyphosphatase / guanosine-5'-triphosphate,3'-diphosphate pyrophosphatase
LNLSRRDNDRNRVSDLEPMGVVDIGSNSVRLVVYEGAVRSPTPIFNEKVLAGLGRAVATTGRLPDDAVQRAIDALTRFRAIVRVLGVKNVRAIATAACREAANGPAFIASAERALGQKIEILTGQQEAALAAHGVQMGFSDPDGFVCDLGGGSLEIIDIKAQALRSAVTLPLGGLRLIDTSGGRMDKALDLVDDSLKAVPWLDQGEKRIFYAVGGTWRSLARLHMEQRDYPLRMMHGYSVPAKEMVAFCEEVRKSKKLSGIRGIEEISKARRDVLPYGALVLERVVRQMKPLEVVFSVYGIREGLLYKLLSKAEQRRDPLLAMAADYARLRSRSIEHAYELCTWTDALFDDGGLKETLDERRLRHAACLLSDIGWRGHPDYRGEQSLNLIAHAAMAGIDHPGRVFLALAVYFRHAGAGDDSDLGADLSERLLGLISPRMLKRARIVGTAIRAAHMLSIGRSGIISDTSLTFDSDQLILTIPRAFAGLDGERLRRRFATLAEFLDRKSVVRLGG